MSTHDVFISYAHVDNEALLEGQDGWISIFQRALQKRLGQLLGRQVAVWWDRQRLSGNQYFDETIAAACESATVMVSVVTPRYLKSDYCNKEVEHFAQSKPIKVGDRSRLFTCVKTPVQRQDLFQQMEHKLGYEFYRAEEGSGRFREYDVFDPELKPMFMAALEDLAQDVGKLLGLFEPNPGAPRHSSITLKTTTPKAAEKQRVFIATTSGDVKAVREGLLRELQTREYGVTPDHAFSEDAAGFEAELVRAAAPACVSVHILGASYGTIPEDADGSYPVLQFERLKQLAADRPQDAPLARIVWIPRGVEGSSEKQKKFLARVRGDATLGPLDELLEGSEEELKERVIAKLQTLERARQEREERAAREQKAAQKRAETGGLDTGLRASMTTVSKVYVISADDEGEDVEAVERALGAQGFDVISSLELAEEETEAEREARHQQLLSECDGCLIYHGATKLSWVRAQIDEVRKALGHRARGPMRGQAVYLAPPVEGLKRRYQVQFPKLEGSSAPDRDLQPFVQQLVEAPSTSSVLPARAAG